MKTVYFAHDQQEAPTGRKASLEQVGLRVELFATSTELLDAVDRARPDLVLLDALVEGDNGFAVAATLHERTREDPLPIVLCARIYRQRSFRELALRAGCADYLLLPIRRTEFVQRVLTAVDPDAAAALEAAAKRERDAA